jgi:uncharacterized membrane protein
MLEFSRPIWLLLLLALPAIVWLALRQSYASLGPFQKWLSLAVRCIVWTLLVCALAGVQFVRVSDRVSVVVARDTSDSVDQAQLQAALGQLETARKSMKKDDSLGKVNFGADAMLEFLPQPGVGEQQLSAWQTKPRTNFTNVAEALQVAVASFPDNAQKRLVLLTDGNENTGNALTESRVARDNGVELFVVPVGSRSGPEVILSNLEAPAKAALGETVNVHFVIDSTVATPADVSLIRNGEFVAKTPINIKPGKEPYTFPVKIDQAGFFTYELALEPKLDTIAQNNRAYTFSVVGGQPRLLYATGDPQELRYLPSSIRTHNIAVDVVPPSGIPYNLSDFQIYDGIIFSDVAAYDISDSQMKMVQTLVRDFGKGFMMIGGEKSFGPGGYFDTPIEETLPVDMDFRRKKITPSTLVVCLIDKSGSMGEMVNGVEKVKMAKEACKQVVKLQSPDDYVGVMGFDGVGQWVVQPTKGINKEDTLNKISSMEAGGGTVLGPALESAYEAAKDIPCQIKHFIIFTDGGVAPDDFEGIAKKMVADNCTISTVAFGSDADIPFMKDLAAWGGGQMYAANSLYDLPKIFTREVFLANKATLNEEPFTALPNGDSPLISSIGWGSAPNLYGYVATSAKDNAQVPLLTPKDDPLLAVWRYGLGKSAAFTSDAKNRWARDWLGWRGYEQFWTGVARWIKNDLDSSGISVQTSVRGSQGVVQVSATSPKGGYVNNSTLEAHITDPDLGARTVRLDQTGPGQYTGSFPLGNNGNYFVNVVQLAPGEAGSTPQPVGAQAAGLALSYSPEYKDLKQNAFLLNQLSQSSLAPPEISIDGLFTQERRPKKRLEEAWELFVLVALCLWLLDVAARRLVLDVADWRALAGAVFAGTASRRALATTEALGGLMRAKQRVASVLPEQPVAGAQVTARLKQRRDQLASQAAARERITSEPVAPPPSQPAGTIGAPNQRAASSTGQISELRQRLIERERGGQPPPPPRVDFENLRKAAANKTEPAATKAPLSDRDFTSELLKRKQQKRQDD